MCTVINEAEVNAIRLSLEFEQAVIAHELEPSGDLLVTENPEQPYWVMFRRTRAALIFMTYRQFRDGVQLLDRLQLCNEINNKYHFAAAHIHGDRLYCDHILLYRDGLTRESFLRVARAFSECTADAFNEFDCAHELLHEPGDNEREGQSDAQ